METTYKYACDCGSLKVGNDRFQMHIGNGCGDGCFDVTISDEEPAGKNWTFECAFQGEDVNIYEYDCESTPIAKVTGTIFVYRNNGDMWLYIFKKEPNHFGDMKESV